jgi:hypothetical protein
MARAGSLNIELFARLNGRDIPVGTITIPLDVKLLDQSAGDPEVRAVITVGKADKPNLSTGPPRDLNPAYFRKHKV